ncbi:MAG TPA: hypothetical protein PKH97_12615 [Tetrasphaera sp.]|uniref:3-keto-disaccharide hydrolase domain-containing protein n=1 Tax=Nostocoides vanveenii TaxID=330835 RepID=A0ABN2KQ97_9MICO|nr:hypothetical protein [Tetrasphaera sp.]HNQ08013.1 hypothetical protein [Tetrasphaera sp.]
MPKGIITALALSASLLAGGAGASAHADQTPMPTDIGGGIGTSLHENHRGGGHRSSPYFRSAFNGPDAGWRNVVGAWSVRNGNLQAMGAPGRFSSVKHVGTFDDFEFEVRMNRVGNSDGSAPNCLIVRANPSRVVKDLWAPGYYFCYSNNGKVLVVAVDARGNQEQLMPWTSVKEVGTGGGYRTVNVIALEHYFAFYVNNTPVFETKDDLSSFGSVGAGFYVERGKRGTLMIDYANLGPVKAAKG